MCKKITLVIFILILVLPVFAQEIDSIKSINLNEVTVVADSFKQNANLHFTHSVDVVERDFLNKHFTGNLIQVLEYIPGVRSMDIGSGFSKPMIRGMGFNRIAVVENGIKQEGQQWGSDHGLEMDAFNVERVSVHKGPMSLLYGSDAMGGVIEILQTPIPFENQIFGEVATLYKSVNNSLGGSAMLGIKKNAWYTKLRFSEQHFGDYRVPTDSIIYLTQRIPIYNRKLKNTAGLERDVSLYTAFRNRAYSSTYSVNYVYQKTGFFPGAHGIPDISRVQNDGNNRNIELPNSKVNHLKISTRQQYGWDKLIGTWDVGFQNNYREEWSAFHTHYGNQSPPSNNPDKELSFNLDTYSSSLKLKTANSFIWEHNMGWDVQYQKNKIGGYSFLLPNYKRFSTGIFNVSTWQIAPHFLLSGGIRYDFAKISIDSSSDPYLQMYLQNLEYTTEEIEQYKWRSYLVKKNFGDFSGSVGVVWSPSVNQVLKVNLGHSFRLPGVNELAANGVHHGTFRHEQGDSTLQSEKGWQLDLSYLYENKKVSVSVTPFLSWFNNYIYLRPTGEWSILPHAGQIYRYTGTKAILAGTEFSFNINFLSKLNYSFNGEYIYTYNQDEHTPLSFSPPASMRNTLSCEGDRLQFYAEFHSIASQERVAKNEAVTPSTHLVNVGGHGSIPLGTSRVDISLTLRNLFNKKYYNHLSFYRKIEIPEPGRSIQLSIKIPFKNLFK